MSTLINTDIYDILSSINNLKKSYVPEEDEETLALSLYGYISDLEAKKIQTAVMMSSELHNEVFPSRAKLDKNVITHAVMYDVKGINATPAIMTIVIGILGSDLDKYMINNKFTIDKNCTIIIGGNDEETFEYHLDYDIILSRSGSKGKYIYSAIYDMNKINRISLIDNPYLSQPFTAKFNSEDYIFIQCRISQISITDNYEELVTSNIIDNKTFTFQFTNQLADFDIEVTEGDGTVLDVVPIIEGSAIDESIEYYCKYTYINDKNIRVKFERDCYVPGLNSEIHTVIKTTKGSQAIFDYNDVLYTDLNSDKYGYYNVNIMIQPSTGSSGGYDRKSISELKQIIPKEILAKGSITTTSDLQNYLNTLNNSSNRLEIYKKEDNQLRKVYYTYFVCKNNEGNVIPTNTINLQIKDTDFIYNEDTHGYVLPAGTIIEYDPDMCMGYIINDINDATTPYIYTNIYSIGLSLSPLYTSSYLNIIYENPYLSFLYINQESELQFICNKIHFERRLLSDRNTYTMEFITTQNINSDKGMIEKTLDENGNEIITDINMRCIIVFYKDGEPYRYKEASFLDYNEEDYTYRWKMSIYTDNIYDYKNNIKILDLNLLGLDELNYGFMNPTTETYIYTLAKFDKSYGISDLGTMIKNIDGWTVTNKYKVYNGIDFFINYSGVSNCHVDIEENTDECNKYMYTINGVAVCGYEYIQDEDHLFDLIEQLDEKKNYLDEVIDILENSFEVDFKFFNTYGPSRVYTLDDDNDEGTISAGRVDITCKFRLSLKSTSDIYTQSSITEYCKEYIEDLDELNDLHFSNLVSNIKEKYKESINFFEFCGFNEFDANKQHMYRQDVDPVDIPPEFINVRNTVVDGEAIPMIDIELLSSTTTSY